MTSTPFTLLAILLVAVPAGAAVTLHQSEEFDTFGGWSSGDPNPNPPVLFPYSGPSGDDSALRLTANGSGGRGGKLVVYNQSTWTGDYTGAGITTIAADLRNLGASNLSIRLAFNGPGGWLATDAVPLAAFAGWSPALFDVRQDMLIPVSGATDASATMSAVTEIRILHANTPGHQGSQVSGILLVDNIRAVPEPDVLISLVIVGVAFLKRKR